jgi:hypothetical protein
MELIVIILLLVALEIGALRFGADSRDRLVDSWGSSTRVGLS